MKLFILALAFTSCFGSVSRAQDLNYVDMECSLVYKGDSVTRIVSFRKRETLAHSFGTRWSYSSPLQASVQFMKSWMDDEFQIQLSLIDNSLDRKEDPVEGVSTLRVKSLSDLPSTFHMVASKRRLFREMETADAATLSCSKR